jgi:FixJ family two-component response regulator
MPEPRCICIVDDDASVRRSLERLLGALGYQAVLAADARACLAATGAQPVSCVIADVTIPGGSGIALAEALRQRGDRVPVILVTAHDSDETRAEARRVGAAAYLRKPVDAQALVDAIEWALSGVDPAGRAQSER